MDPTFIDGLWIAAQPIVNLSTGEVIGYESLIRGQPPSAWISPAQLFAEAKRQGIEGPFDMHCRTLGLTWGQWHLSPEQRLFLTIHGDSATLPINTDKLQIDPTRIAREISPSHNVRENIEYWQQIQRWREEGYHIVLDDGGVGYAGWEWLLTAQPHRAQIARFLIAGIDHDQMRQSLITHSRELARDHGVVLGTEGLETASELRCVQQLDSPFGQGFFVEQPAANPITQKTIGAIDYFGAGSHSFEPKLEPLRHDSDHSHGIAQPP